MIPNFYRNLILTALVLTQISASSSQGQNFYYQTCRQPLQWCGHQISYPFWGGGRPVSCGLPGFELRCDENEAPILTIAATSYRVIRIDYPTETLTVARSDFWNTICPANVSPTNVDFTLFDYSSSDRNITLYYGCPNLVPLPNRFNCSGAGGLNFYTTEWVELETGLICPSNVSVPVNQSAFEALLSSSQDWASENLLRDALMSGFSLRWTEESENCTNCLQSGGVCGYDRSSAAFACHSPVPVNNRPGVGLYIGLSIAGAVAAGVVLGWLIFYCQQRRVSSKAAASHSQQIPSPPTNTSPFTTDSSASFTSFNRSSGPGSNYFGLQVFSYSELEQATDGFNPCRELGDGGFGIVYYGILSDRRHVAIKRLYGSNFRRLEQFMNELEILSRLRHENLVILYGCTSRRSSELLLVYEYIPNGTVADHLHGAMASACLLSWSVRLNIAIETADALAYLHKSDIIHRDVKTSNVLLDREFHVKVADFGLSRLFPNDVSHVSTAPQGTPGYVDPEYYRCYRLTEKSDVYSFGVILIELVSSLQAVDTGRDRSDINLSNMAVSKIQNHGLHELVDPNLGFDTNCEVRRMVTLVAGLAFRCLQQDKDMRPSMEQVVEELKFIKNGSTNAHETEAIDVFSDDEEPLNGRDVWPASRAASAPLRYSV